MADQICYWQSGVTIFLDHSIAFDVDHYWAYEQIMLKQVVRMLIAIVVSVNHIFGKMPCAFVT